MRDEEINRFAQVPSHPKEWFVVIKDGNPYNEGEVCEVVRQDGTIVTVKLIENMGNYPIGNYPTFSFENEDDELKQAVDLWGYPDFY